MNILVRSAALLAVAMTLPALCAAQHVSKETYSSSGNFGWGSEGFYFKVSDPFVTGCTYSDQVVIKSSHPLFKENLVTVLMGITTQTKLSVTVKDCYNGRPDVVAVGVISN